MRQNYRLSRWRTSATEIVYRRFFDINSLVGVRVEDEFVFADTHATDPALVALRPAGRSSGGPSRRPA